MKQNGRPKRRRKRPYRDSALLYGTLAAIIVVVAAEPVDGGVDRLDRRHRPCVPRAKRRLSRHQLHAVAPTKNTAATSKAFAIPPPVAAATTTMIVASVPYRSALSR